ncbi:MAG: DUF4209 domain-containing protein [Prevotellaceae bacterium]|nr:DUF4209 domain-containing protein [Candidatus Faecinaster equi]
MTKLKEILETYDNPNKKGFEYYEMSSDIRTLPEIVVSGFDAQAEILAMMFQDNSGKDDWGTYYGPMLSGTRTNKETGETEPAYNPDYHLLTEEQFSYWEKRASETNNPFLKMRYLGLIYDFKEKVVGEDATFQDIKYPYVEAIIKVVLEEYYRHEVEGFFYVERAMQCAVALNNQTLIADAKNALFALNEKTKDDDKHSGLWGRTFLLMLSCRDRFTEQEIQQLVEEAESRFQRINDNVQKYGKTTDEYAHLLKEQAEVLCQYYNKCENPAKVEMYLDQVCAAINLAANARGGMWLHGMLNQMQVLYRKYHFEKKANRLYVDIQKTGNDALSEMQKIEIPISLDRKLIERYINDALSGTNEEVLQRFIVANIPNSALEKQRQMEESKQSVLLDLMTTTTYDEMGSPINHVGVGKDAEEQKFMHGMYNRMTMTSVFLRMIIEKMIEKQIFTYESVMQAFADSTLIHPQQKPLFDRGIKAYFEKDYMVACHLLIPQFESAIRTLVASQGGEILKPEQNPIDGNRYLALEGLLEREVMKEVFPEDVLIYFKNLFTDHNGWNLRNKICHGLFPADSFNATMADRIVHAFMVLSELKEVPSV